MAEKKEKKGLLKRIPKPVLIFGGSLVAVFAITVATLFILYTDKNRLSPETVEAKTEEVIKKNYVNGFSDISSTGKFNFVIPESEMNSILKSASKSIKSELVETIYYGKSAGNHHYFYVDLNLPVVTSRATIDTVASVNKDLSINLKIEKVKLGKVGGKNFLKKKGILNESFLNSFFKVANLPIIYKENKESFTVAPLNYIDSFPESSIATTFINVAREHSNKTIKINTSNLGFQVDFSKLRSSSSLSVIDTDDDISTFKDELDTACASVVIEPEPKNLHQISKDEMDLALSKSIAPQIKEEYKSNGKTDKNYLASITTSYGIDYMNINFIYSINGYLVDVVMPFDFINDYTSDYQAYFEFQYECEIGSYHYEDFEDVYVNFYLNHLRLSLKNLYSKAASIFEFDETDDSLSVFYLYTGSRLDVQNAIKSIELSDNSINFVIQSI